MRMLTSNKTRQKFYEHQSLLLVAGLLALITGALFGASIQAKNAGHAKAMCDQKNGTLIKGFCIRNDAIVN